MPYKCPPAPYEAAMLAASFLARRGVRAEVAIASPEPQPLPIAGKECGDTVRSWVEERGVRVLNGRQVVEVLPGRVRFADGGEEPFDVLAVVPPHKPPPLVAQLFGGWAPADAATLATALPDVWAVGDCTVVKLANGKPLVKAGVMAEGEARVVARNLAAGETVARFDGKGSCFLELGEGLGVEVAGDFYATPQPIVAARPPSKASLEAKHRFEAERLARWFGG
jgi:sulfide:quinone oxidoreductase